MVEMNRSVCVRLKALFIFATILCAHAAASRAQTIASPFSAHYAITGLGSVPGVPGSYGGVTFLATDPNTLLIGGNANNSSGGVYAIAVVRNGSGHITGFSGTASLLATANDIDGGLAYGPSQVLFFTEYSDNVIGEIKSGSAVTNKSVLLTPLSVTPSVGALEFVPSGFPGAGEFKIDVYSSGNWYTLAFASDGSGTFDITSATLETTLAGSPQGFVYAPMGAPDFALPSILVNAYSNDEIDAYQVDSNGDPVPSTAAVFASGFSGPEGAAVDPVTNDLIISDFSDSVVYVISGFTGRPTNAAPTLSVSGLTMAAAVLLLVGIRRLRRSTVRSV